MNRFRQRFTFDGPAELEALIEDHQQQVTAAVSSQIPARQLRALVLAGGYGRGEGGFCRHGQSYLPYNDYDYFVVVQRMSSPARYALRRRLQALANTLTQRLGVEVDFAILAAEKLADLPSCLMYSELKACHRILYGDERVLESILSAPVDQLPLAEFSRMMLNRGALLLMNSMTLLSGEPHSPAAWERFLRYLSKGLLAAGDARLAAAGRYCVSTRQRRIQLASMHWPRHSYFMSLYDMAMRIRQGGEMSAPLEFGGLPELQQLVVSEWLAAFQVLESARLGHSIDTWERYAAVDVDKGQARHGWRGPLYDLLSTVRGLGLRMLLSDPLRLLHHPRERLMASLPLLLSGAPNARMRSVAEALGLWQRSNWRSLAQCFLRDWSRYC